MSSEGHQQVSKWHLKSPFRHQITESVTKVKSFKNHCIYYGLSTSSLWILASGPSFWWSRDGMMPECRGWMCLNHSKTNGFWRISLLSPIQRFGVGEVVFRCHVDTRWWPWGYVLRFLRYWKDIGIFIYFQWFLETPGSESSIKVDVKNVIPAWQY